MKLTITNAKNLLELLNTAKLTYNKLSQDLATTLIDEDLVLVQTNKSRKTLVLRDKENLETFVYRKFNINNLENYVNLNQKNDITRKDLIGVSNDSKTKQVRTFCGFLIKINDSIQTSLGELKPTNGMAFFVEDYKNFTIPKDVVIVGFENAENFRYAHKLKYLFGNKSIVFVCRYPQESDLRSWLKTIPNKYIHFGDFDLAGISIFQNEFYSQMGSRAEFFVPNDIEQRIKNGNAKLYINQLEKFSTLRVIDPRVQNLVNMINKYHKCYEQEGYIE